MNRGRGVRKRTAPEKSDAFETCNEEIRVEIHQLFNKVRGYVPPAGGEWRLPDPSVVLCDPHVSHPRLQALKQSLNEVKNQLSDKDLSVMYVSPTERALLRATFAPQPTQSCAPRLGPSSMRS